VSENVQVFIGKRRAKRERAWLKLCEGKTGYKRRAKYHIRHQFERIFQRVKT
jgi:hypothetical protein